MLHPVHCLQSRIANITIGRTDAHALEQLRGALVCARASQLELLERPGHVRDVLKWNEYLFRYAQQSDIAAISALRYGVDPFDAVLLDERLPEKFRTVRYPQMQRQMKLIQPKRLSACLAHGRDFEQAWISAAAGELAKVRSVAMSRERQVGVLLDKQRERVHAHDLQKPQAPGRLATMLGVDRRYEAVLRSWGFEDRRLRIRREQLEKRAVCLQEFARVPPAEACATRGTQLANARARRHNRGLAREVESFREWMRSRAVPQLEQKHALDRGERESELLKSERVEYDPSDDLER